MEEPKVGMGATLVVGSDRYPYTIIIVSENKKTIWATPDGYKPTSRHDYYGTQDYIYTTVINATAEEFTLRKNGRWVKKGESLHTGLGLHIGERRAYQDPSF